MLTVAQVAERLQVSTQIVYALVAEGKILAHRIGLGRGTIRVAEADLQEYLLSCKQDVQRIEAPPSSRRRLKHLRLK